MTSAPEPAVHRCECEACQAGSELELARHHRHINLLLSRMTEPQRRWYVATLAAAPHAPSISALALITGLDPKTIQLGRQELAADLTDHPPSRQRRPGGGRPRAEKKIRAS
ncbi:MAG: hypothetical protein NVS4B8_30890 [Herpetosiphon sp.]